MYGQPNYYMRQPSQDYSTYFQAPQPQVPQLKGRPVSSIEEARAAQIDFDGSLFIFPDIANHKIYTKQINMDGTAAMNVYAIVQEAPPAAPPAYVTKEEFDSVVNNLKELIAKNEQVVANF